MKMVAMTSATNSTLMLAEIPLRTNPVPDQTADFNI